MLTTFSSRAWYEYTGWQLDDKKILKRINALIKDIERNGNTGIGKPEPLKNLCCRRLRILRSVGGETCVRRRFGPLKFLCKPTAYA